MKKYSASVARERFSDALDAAENGEAVIIERKGVRYRLTVDTGAAPVRTSRRKPLIDVIDEKALEHGWTWHLGEKGLRFRRRRAS